MREPYDIPCPTCDGERTSAMSDAIPCSTCGGTAEATRPRTPEEMF